MLPSDRSSSSLSSSSSQSTTPNSRPAEPAAYDVKFSCNVPYAKMYIDGDNYGHVNGTYTLLTGSHRVKLVANGYEDYQTTIQVRAGSTSFNFNMSKLIPMGSSYVAKVETITVNGVPFDMIFVEGGTFMMGATAEHGSDADSDERPIHKVTLSDYYIGKNEVTQELWQAVMGKNPSKFKNNLKNPVEGVSWNDCQKFVKKLNKLTGKNFRLPTEAEWDYAARGGNFSQGYKYAGSNNLDAVAWYDSNSAGKTHPVGSKHPNELGIYDMSGNVLEWCQDWYGYYSSDPQTNPQGLSGSYRVRRGGCWQFSALYNRVSDRYYWTPKLKNDHLGLRLAASSIE